MRIEVDYLVMGSGVAGLFFAIQAAEHGRVAVVTKRDRSESNTRYAQGGIAAVMDQADSVAQHARDTESAGAGLCRTSVVESVIAEGPAVIAQLVELGARFTRDTSGALSLAREGGHDTARVVRADDRAPRVRLGSVRVSFRRRRRKRRRPRDLLRGRRRSRVDV